MDLDIGMSRKGLLKLAHELITACDSDSANVEIMLYAQPNGRGDELVLTFNNDDMENRDDVTEDTVYWEMNQ